MQLMRLWIAESNVLSPIWVNSAGNFQQQSHTHKSYSHITGNEIFQADLILFLCVVQFSQMKSAHIKLLCRCFLADDLSLSLRSPSGNQYNSRPPESSDNKYNLTVVFCLPIRDQSDCVAFQQKSKCTLNSYISSCDKVHYCNSFHAKLFPVVSLKICSIPTSALKSPNKFMVAQLGKQFDTHSCST